MMEMHLVSVKSFANYFDANLAVARLSDEGIKAMVKNEDSVLAGLTNPQIDVLVEDHNLELAREILSSME